MRSFWKIIRPSIHSNLELTTPISTRRAIFLKTVLYPKGSVICLEKSDTYTHLKAKMDKYETAMVDWKVAAFHVPMGMVIGSMLGDYLNQGIICEDHNPIFLLVFIWIFAALGGGLRNRFGAIRIQEEWDKAKQAHNGPFDH
jgi:hypothetical protein